MANIISGVFSGVRFFIENPIWALAIVLGILLMPLEVFDILLFILVNIIVLLINVIIFILFTLFNIIVWGVNGLFDVIWSFLSKNLLILILEVFGRSLPLW